MILADLKNKETDVRIRKTDLITGEEISGAVLSIKSLDGKLLKEWVSGEEIQITGILKPGETYLLAEVLPATGYAWAEEVPFTVGGDGGIHRVRMGVWWTGGHRGIRLTGSWEDSTQEKRIHFQR